MLIEKTQKTTIGVTKIHWKNLVDTIRLKGDEAKFGHGSKGTLGLRDGDVNVVIEGQTHQFLPQSDAGVWQPRHGICFHEGITCHLSTKE